ncbi:MAG: lytic transglycosylase domain-containing protein [Anaerolineales bacterium]|nr:lytic transglycosylase domain-containing protein [Anaerolineales bacterium]NUQ84114.1 lytic transglycosylase domain-containing protein [Anaerolineales bacterium]
MPRARTANHDLRQTAATQDGSGCLSLYSLPLFAILLIACLLTALSFNTPVQTSAMSAAPINSPAASNGISPIFTREVQHWANDIARWANASSLDPNLVAVVMQIESCGDPRARSSAGAMGLFQVMPFHFQSGENPYDPNTNALRGLNYLSRSLNTSRGNVRLALAGYNGGIGVIARGEWTWSAQTLRYVYYGAPIYEDARSGAAFSPKLDEWYRKYGAGLCRQASRRLEIE